MAKRHTRAETEAFNWRMSIEDIQGRRAATRNCGTFCTQHESKVSSGHSSCSEPSSLPPQRKMAPRLLLLEDPCHSEQNMGPIPERSKLRETPRLRSPKSYHIALSSSPVTTSRSNFSCDLFLTFVRSFRRGRVVFRLNLRTVSENGIMKHFWNQAECHSIIPSKPPSSLSSWLPTTNRPYFC